MKLSICGSILLFATTPVLAHITLEQGSAEAGSSYKAVFRVPHGCDGSPTRAITVFLPEGIVGAKPMPKAGWRLEVKIEKLAKPYDSHGKLIGERPVAISWSGGRLLDSEYDEFVMHIPLQSEPGVARFRILQQCERGQIDWVETATEGKDAPRYPAPVLEITPAQAGAHHH